MGTYSAKIDKVPWLAGWTHRIKLTIDHTKVDAALTQFPVLIHLAASCGQDSQDMTRVFDELGAESLKLAVTEDDGLTELNVEVAAWDNTAEEAHLWVSKTGWVISATTDTVIYLYYDSCHADNTGQVGVAGSTPGQAVWDSYYGLIDHMKDGADTSHTVDSTGNSNGTKHGPAQPAEVAQDEGYAQDFDPATGDDIQYPSPVQMGTGDITVEVLYKPRTVSNYQAVYFGGATGGANGFGMMCTAARTLVCEVYGTTGGRQQILAAEVITLNELNYASFVTDRSLTEMYSYINGALANTWTLNDPGTVTGSGFVGAHAGTGWFLDADVYEVRLSNTTRSAAWIKASNAANRDDLLTYEDYTDETVQILKGSLHAEKQIEERSTARFTVVDEAGTAEYYRGDPVAIYDDTGGTAFTGYVDTVERRRMAPADSGLLHDIECMDQHYLADKRLAIKSYQDETAGDIVTDLFDDYLDPEGVTIGQIDTGPTLEEAIFNYAKVSICLDELAELAGYIWYIDQGKKLYFIARDTNEAAWHLTSADGSHRPIAGSVRTTNGNRLYRNRQYIRGGHGTTAQQTETFTGDGTTVAFTVGYPINSEPTVTVAGAPKTVGIKGVETGHDCYWNKGDATITFSSAPAGAAAVVVVYYGQYPLITVANNSASSLEQAAIDGTTGINEDIVEEAFHDSSDATKRAAKAKLLRYCQDAVSFSYQTHMGGLEPGQLQEITYSPVGYSAEPMLIERVDVRTNGQYIIYDVRAIKGPTMGSWSKFFGEMVQRQINSIKLGDQLLLVLFVEPEDLDLAEATDTDSDDFTGGIVNRWIQTPPAQASGYNVEHEKLNLSGATDFLETETEDYAWG